MAGDATGGRNPGGGAMASDAQFAAGADAAGALYGAVTLRGLRSGRVRVSVELQVMSLPARVLTAFLKFRVEGLVGLLTGYVCCKLTCWVCGTHLSTSERNRPRGEQVSE